MANFLEWWLQLMAVVIALACLVIAQHAWTNIELQGVKAVGETGEMGPPGYIGKRGFLGIRGPFGPAGKTGATGGTGPTGPTGDTAPQGPTGPQGIRGFRGPVGQPLFTGPTGPTGFAGFDSVTGPTGPTGNQLAVGPTGSTGQTGAATLPFVFATYTLPRAHLVAHSTTFASPLVRNAKMLQSQLYSAPGETFTFEEGIIAFVQSPSANLAFNLRVSISGSVSGGLAGDFVGLYFRTLPLSTNASWQIPTTYSPARSAHLFSATLIDTISPAEIAWHGDFSFDCVVANTDSYLNIGYLSMEIAQLST